MSFFKIPARLVKYLMDRGDKKGLKSVRKIGTYNTTKNINYLGREEYTRDHLLDIYFPVDGYNGCTIINVHGGGYYQGDKDFSEVYCSYYVDKGFIVANLNYPLIDNSRKIDIRDQIQAVVMGINYVYDHRTEYDIDVDNLFIMGDSAGGHLIQMANLVFQIPELKDYYQIPFLNPVHFNAMQLSSSMYDYEDLRKQALDKMFKGGAKLLFSKHIDNDEYIRKNSPKTYVENEAIKLPPMFIITAENDYFKEETIKLHLALKKRNAEHIYHFEHSTAKYVGHVFNHFNLDKKECKEANDKTIEFFLAHKKEKANV